MRTAASAVARSRTSPRTMLTRSPRAPSSVDAGIDVLGDDGGAERGKSSTVARPSPPAAPVTMATRSSKARSAIGIAGLLWRNGLRLRGGAAAIAARRPTSTTVMTSPLAMCLASIGRPATVTATTSSVSRKAPKTVPTTEAVPPAMRLPPSTTAPTLVSRNGLPSSRSALPTEAASSAPVRPASAPLMHVGEKDGAVDGDAGEVAARRLCPTASSRRP